MTLGPTATAGLLCAVMAGPAFGHITLQTREAAAGSAYRAVLRVGHGCEGAPTTVIRVQIPEGVIAVRPMPKPGWRLETTTGEYAEPVQYYDQTLAEGVQEIIWSGGELPDDWYDEFIFLVQLPQGEPGQVLYFPLVQHCGETVARWIEIPAEGQSADELAEPAPSVTLTEPLSGQHD